MNPRPSILPLLMMLAASRGLLPGQAPSAPVEPPALAATRAAFLRQVMADSQLLTEQYERALAKAEGEVAAGGDYEEAKAISQRREQLRALYAGTASSLAIPLPVDQARLMGASQASGEMITGWRSNGSGAEWQNFRLLPGTYHLELEANMSDAPVAGSIYASSKFQPQQSAAFEFGETTLLGTAAENRRTFEITRSVDETTFATVRAGPLQFTHTPVTLRLIGAAGYPANIIRIRNLRLVPVTEDTAAAAPAPSDGAATLQKAAAAFATALNTAKTTATAAYLADLQRLAAEQPGLRDQVQAETRRIQRLADQKTGPTGIRSIATGAGSLDGFEDISDAYLAEEAPAAGDRFSVTHDSQVLKIRLLWVACAPAEEGAPGLKAFARYFKIEEESALDMGRAARNFTASYLRDKPLRLLVRPDRDKDGTLAALLFLPDVGLYQNVLVDHGYAAVAPPPRDSRRNATEKALIATLHARENDARTRQPPMGAWELSTDTQGGRRP